MRKLNFDQGTESWLEWRKSIITATDAPVIMGVSPYATPHQLWMRKTGQAPEQKVNSAMLRGQADEPIARQMFIDAYGIPMEPCCIESSEYNFLGASLDGISPCGNFFCEIKSNGDQYHYGVQASAEIPEFHKLQMQHQFLCSDKQFKLGYYVSYNRGDVQIIAVEPDYKFMERYLPKALEFRKQIVLGEPPALTCKDYRQFSDNSDLQAHCAEYIRLNNAIKDMTERKEYYKNKIIESCNGENSKGYGIKALNKNTKGFIDYSLVPELQGVNLEPYRKPSSPSWTIMIDKK